MSAAFNIIGFFFAIALQGCLSNTFHGPEKLVSTNPEYIKNENYVPAKVLNLGHDTYMNYCMQCHGVSGDGNGPAAPGMNPQPRNFTQGVYKFISAKSGELPTDEDLKKTIRYGLSGTQMLPWDISDERLEAVVQYIKTFAPKIWKEGTPGTAWASHENPWKGKETAAIELGKKVYHGQAQCYSCHAAYVSPAEIQQYTKELTGGPAGELRADLNLSIVQDSDYGHKFMPPDFTSASGWIKTMRKHGTSEEGISDIYRTIGSGVGGTTMPSWEGVLSSNADATKQVQESHERQWALAYYVNSLHHLKFDASARKKFFDELNAKRTAEASQKPSTKHAANQ